MALHFLAHGSSSRQLAILYSPVKPTALMIIHAESVLQQHQVKEAIELPTGQGLHQVKEAIEFPTGQGLHQVKEAIEFPTGQGLHQVKEAIEFPTGQVCTR